MDFGSARNGATAGQLGRKLVAAYRVDPATARADAGRLEMLDDALADLNAVLRPALARHDLVLVARSADKLRVLAGELQAEQVISSMDVGALIAQAEAGAAFSNKAVYLEKYIVQPRHVEIQVLADAEADVVFDELAHAVAPIALSFGQVEIHRVSPIQLRGSSSTRTVL